MPRGAKPFAHAAIDAGLPRVAFEARAPALAECLDAFSVQRHFARWQQADALERVQRALRFGVEAADGFDVLIERSMRSGSLEPVGNTSSSEPRIANSPGLVTWLTLA